MHAVVETALFLRRAEEAGMTEGERFDLVTFIGDNPDAGNLVQGTGGVRKVRFSRRDKGKSGGYRIITFFTGADLPVFLITVFAKGSQSDLTKSERNDLAKLTATLKATYARKITSPG